MIRFDRVSKSGWSVKSGMEGRSIVGRGYVSKSSYPYYEYYSLGERGGRIDTVLTDETLPRHRHDIYVADSSSGRSGSYDAPALEFSTNRSRQYTSYSGSSSPTPVDIRNPYYAMTWCVKN